MMQWALARTNRNSMKNADEGAYMMFNKSVAPNSCNTISKDHESATITLNDLHRYIFVTFVALPLDEHCKIVAPFLLPVHGSDPINQLASETHGKMDGLKPVPSTFLFQVDLRRTHFVDHTFAAKPFSPNHSSRSNFIGQIRNRVAAKLQNKLTKRSANSWQKIADSSNVSSGLSDTYSSSTSDSGNQVTSDSSNQVNDITRVDKHGRSSRKKPKRKGKRNKKSPELISSVSIEEEGVQEISSCNTGDADCASSNCLMVKLPRIKEHTSRDALVNEGESTKLLSFEACSATSKVSSLEESNITEEPGSSMDVAVEPLTENSIRGKKNSSNGATSTSVSSQSTNQVGLGVKSAEGKTRHGDASVGSITDRHDASISEPSFDGWYSEGSLSGNNDIINRVANKEEHEIRPSDSGVVSDGSNCSTTSHNVPFEIGNLSREKSCDLGQEVPENLHDAPGDCSNIAADNADRIKISSGNCSSTNDHDFVPGRKSRLANKLVQSSSGIASRSSYANAHARTGKENNHSVWQKVLRSSSNEGVPKRVNCDQFPQDVCESTSSCIRYDLGQRRNKQEKSGQCASLYGIAAQESSDKVASHAGDSEASLLKGGHVTKNKNPENLNTRLNVGSKVEHTYQPRKSLPNRSGLTRASKKKPFHAGAAEVSQQYVHHRSSNSAIAYSHYVPCLKTDIGKAEVIDSYNSFSAQDSHTDSAAGFTPGETSRSTERAFEHEVKLDSGTKFTQGTMHSSDLGHVDVYQGQTSKANNSLQLYHDNGPEIKLEETNVYQENGVVSQSCDYISTHTGLGNFVTGSSSLVSSSSLEQPDKSSHDAPSRHRVDEASILATSNAYVSISLDGQERSISEGTLSELVEAVHDAYMVQLESEDHQLATGSHLAEFERVLHAASPMLSTCQTSDDGVSLCNELSRDFVCKRQISDHTLRTLWQWYEEPGCYGLKVKVENFQISRRQGANLNEPCAYFLPLLSAVQLFGRSRASSSSGSHTSSTEPTDVCRNEKPTSLTKFWHLPGPSILLPKPLKAEAAADDDKVLHTRPQCLNESSASNYREGHTISQEKELCATCSDGSKLLFQYFESERPQQRKPLFEKIKELVESDASPSSQMHGDSSHLVNLSLCDLHPASWFAVAWYPIYRIPEDSLRTAFLTYHSLGHFINGGSALDSSNLKFVSPVVGLQRYNDQGECWFSLKKPLAISPRQNQSCDPSVILEKRLATLEKAASMMSRASVCKDGEITMNRHPDYEFFLSRRW